MAKWLGFPIANQELAIAVKGGIWFYRVTNNELFSYIVCLSSVGDIDAPSLELRLAWIGIGKRTLVNNHATPDKAVTTMVWIVKLPLTALLKILRGDLIIIIQYLLHTCNALRNKCLHTYDCVLTYVLCSWPFAWAPCHYLDNSTVQCTSRT